LRSRDLEKDADSALETLGAEETTLKSAQENAGEDLVAAETLAAEFAATLAETESLLERLTAALAEWNAKKGSLERSQSVATGLLETSTNQLADAQARLDAALESAKDAPDVHAAEAETERARGASDAARAAAADARVAFQDAETAEAAARGPLEAAEREVQRLSAEVKALGDLLHPEGEGLFPPLVDAVTVQSGYEAALGAALGDDLQAPLDVSSPHHWRDLGAFDFDPNLPEGAKPLSDFVKAPGALGRRLAMTGLVFPDQGAALQASLKPGQSLVSARGDLWRWDGFVASAEAPSASAIRLSQRNRLTALEGHAEEARALRAERFAEYSVAKDAAQAAREALRTAESEERAAGQALTVAQDQATRAARAAAERASQLASLESEIRRLAQSVEAAEESRQQAANGLAELGDGIELNTGVAEARSKTAEARTQAGEARGALESLRREGEARVRRLKAIEEEQNRWNARKADAQRQSGELARRQEELGVELMAAEAVPEQIAEKRNALLDAIATAETARNEASDARQQAETVLAEADKLAKAADAALSAAREERARAQALSEAASQRIEELKIRIQDELECAPTDLAERAEIQEGEDLPPLEQAEKRVERLKNEREQLGGVNLRAEEEAAEQEARMATLTADRDDLTGAIERLRRGIQSLNKEGRERLLASFEKVNANFQELFTKLFEGGEAKLTFTESEDPLEAGLEIFARPPGKRLQSLALLSGGEQALTAMALIFAVFLVNPAPVCVLDEVDAPLDDANVERFCKMLVSMSEMSGTRFLVITHHALTMSRMDRLFGVTMAERGVSQLVSVSLSEAEKIAAE
jgi:chromosome segregation protein